eukprot:scaffold246_cov414-Prasinococcus_capsulatus_cf.AAC.17
MPRAGGLPSSDPSRIKGGRTAAPAPARTAGAAQLHHHRCRCRVRPRPTIARRARRVASSRARNGHENDGNTRVQPWRAGRPSRPILKKVMSVRVGTVL